MGLSIFLENNREKNEHIKIDLFPRDISNRMEKSTSEALIYSDICQ